MKGEIQTMTLQELVNLAQQGKLNPNPIGQRPPTTSGPKKSIQIIKSIVSGYGCGMITVRDISEDVEAKKLYGNHVQYLVIDGGHRIRALVAFYTSKISVNGQLYADMDDFNLNDIIVPVDVRQCTSREATELFRKINTTTPVNFMEMVMSDEESVVCEFIRSQTMQVKEYCNDTHSLFSYHMSGRGEWVVDNFNTAPNPRRKWDEYVAIALIRALGGGLVDAGQTEIEQIASNVPPITEKSKKIVDRFLTDCKKLRKFRGKKFNSDTFAAFLVYWFGLYGENQNFAVKDDSFYADFMHMYTKLTGTSNSELDDELFTPSYQRHQEFVKPFVRSNIKNYSNGQVQKEVFSLMREHSDGDGIVFRDPKRSLSSEESEGALAAQGYVCAIDGLPLSLKDAVFAHDTAWSKGGRSELANGAMIRAEHNRDMGTLTLDEYRLILQARAS